MKKDKMKVKEWLEAGKNRKLPKEDQEVFDQAKTGLKEFQDSLKNQFEGSLNKSESFLRGQNKILPDNYIEVMIDWYIQKYPEKANFSPQELPLTKEILVEWSFDYSAILKQKFEQEIKQTDKPKGRQPKRIDFIDLITNETGYKEKYKNELRQNFINEFSDYDGVSLAKLFKSLEELGFFKVGYESNPKRTIYLAIKKEFNSEPKNERGFTLKDIEADKSTLEKLKEIGFYWLQNLK